MPISGVEFTVINQETNEVIEVLTTDKDGYAISGKLDYGNYILRETKTPDGYLPADDQYFSITQDEELISYAIVNTRSPITGESAPTTAFVLLIASIIMIVLILAIKGKMVKALVKAKH